MRFPLPHKSTLRGLSLGLSLVLFSACVVACGPADDYEEPGEDVRVENKYGSLRGKLIFPEKVTKTVPAVIIVPAAGSIDRNGNTISGIRSNAYIQLAARLAERGVAALRYDKAGMSGSLNAAPRYEEDVRFKMGATDLALFIAALREDERIDSITLVGHAEGALVAMLAHAEEKVEGIVTVAAPGRPLGDDLREEIEKSIKDAKLRKEALAILDKLIMGKKVKDVPASLYNAFRPTVQPYLMSWLKYDPAEELAMIDVPTMIVHGTNDREVPISNVELLATASPESDVHEIKGMNHILKLDSGKTLEEQVYKSYSSPAFELAPELVKILAKFAKQ